MTSLQIVLDTIDAQEARLKQERAERLHYHEERIERGLAAFAEAADSWRTIRDEALYTDTYPSFEAYCKARWNFGKSRGYQLMASVNVIENMSTFVDSLPLPEREYHTRPMTGLEPREAAIVWTVVHQIAVDTNGGKVTGAVVKRVVKAFDEFVTTGAIDPGTGESVPIVADALRSAMTQDAYESMKRQQGYIKDNVKPRDMLLNESGIVYGVNPQPGGVMVSLWIRGDADTDALCKARNDGLTVDVRITAPTSE